MIYVRLVSKGEDEFFAFESSGHAGNAEYGKDIVCAAVTALLRTGVLTLQNAYKCGSFEVEIEAEGAGSLSASVVKSGKKDAERLRFLFEFLAVGLLSIEEDYPDCLTVKILNEKT